MTESLKRRQVGLFGGSFNPPHVCHALASLWALQTTAVSEVWWVPTYQHAFGKDLASFEDRLHMCQKACETLAHVHVSDVERSLGGESRTIDTVKHLQKEYPECDFWLIVGTDILREVSEWKNWDGLMELVNLVVVGRGGYLDDAAMEEGSEPTFALPAVSSTAIRQALRQRQWDAPILQHWVATEVIAYVRSEELYQG